MSTTVLNSLVQSLNELQTIVQLVEAQLVTLEAALTSLTTRPPVTTIHVGDLVSVRVWSRETWTPRWRRGHLTALEQTREGCDEEGTQVHAVALTSPFKAWVTSLEPQSDPDAFTVCAGPADIRPISGVNDLPSDEDLEAKLAWESLL